VKIVGKCLVFQTVVRAVSRHFSANFGQGIRTLQMVLSDFKQGYFG